jgi:hypothetical protein
VLNGRRCGFRGHRAPCIFLGHAGAGEELTTHVIAPLGWFHSYLSSPAADHVRAYLDKVLLDLEGAQIQRAIARLEGWVWPEEIERAGLPVKVVEVTVRKIVEAYRYLVEADPDVTSAKDALQDARALWDMG